MARVVAQAIGLIVVESHRSLTLTHRLLERGHNSLLRLVRYAHTVHDEFYGVYLVAVEFHTRRNLSYFAVNACVDISALGQRLEQLAVVSLAALDDGGHKGYFATFESLENKVANLLVGVVYHLLVGNGGVGA